jgi:hypothetical protein
VLRNPRSGGRLYLGVHSDKDLPFRSFTVIWKSRILQEPGIYTKSFVVNDLRLITTQR